MQRGKKLKDFVGKNEKTKIIAKIQKVILLKDLNYLTFQSLDLEHTCWRLSQKHVLSFQSLDLEYTWWRLFQKHVLSFQSLDLEHTWWRLFQKHVLSFQSLDLEHTWWRLFQKHVLSFQSLDLEHTWWRLFQKHVMHTKLDIYIIITISGSIPLLCNSGLLTTEVIICSEVSALATTRVLLRYSYCWK